MSVHISPTVGRMLWFWPNPRDPRSKDAGTQPLAAQVAHVNEDGTVNLGVLTATGNWTEARRVLLVQGDEPVPVYLNYATWMPYQIGQAAKTEQAEKELAARPWTPPFNPPLGGSVVDAEFPEVDPTDAPGS